MPSKTPTRFRDEDDDDQPAPDLNDVVKAAAEDEDEAAEEGRPSRSDDGPKIRGGWTEAQKQMDKGSNYAQSLKLEEKAVFVKFIDDTPYANFRRHWIERNTKDGRQLRAWTCLDTVGKACPLCEVGDRAQSVAAFNVALIGDDGQYLLKSWDVGPRLYGVLKGYANDPRIGPLTKGNFACSKTGKRGTVQHNVAPISKTSLLEDYDLVAPTQADLDSLGSYGPEIIPIPSLKDLRELAEEIADEYE